jgi:hypothetical protein
MTDAAQLRIHTRQVVRTVTTDLEMLTSMVSATAEENRRAGEGMREQKLTAARSRLREAADLLFEAEEMCSDV